ncbi:hypothetical protein PENTCL1PPCAC_9219, partial [Pristionchus entomophagus]
PRPSQPVTKSIECGRLPVLAVRLPFSIDERRTWKVQYSYRIDRRISLRVSGEVKIVGATQGLNNSDTVFSRSSGRVQRGREGRVRVEANFTTVSSSFYRSVARVGWRAEYGRGAVVSHPPLQDTLVPYCVVRIR